MGDFVVRVDGSSFFLGNLCLYCTASPYPSCSHYVLSRDVLIPGFPLFETENTINHAYLFLAIMFTIF